MGSSGFCIVWLMDMMSMVFWLVREKMFEVVKKGRVFDREVEVIVGEDLELFVEEVFEIDLLCLCVFLKSGK